MRRAIPDPKSAKSFRFVRCGYEPSSGLASLVYAFDNGPELTETLAFPYAPWPPEASRQAAFSRALHLLHLLAGVSYYKAGLPPAIQFETGRPGPLLAAFLERVYRRGLAEFAYQNELDAGQRIQIQAGGRDVDGGQELLLRERALVAMGGGKDSLVALELMRAAGVECQPICVGQSELIRQSVSASGLPLLRVHRWLAPELATMNAEGAFNGHVPITAINSAILVCAAILYGYSDVVFANERSCDEATLVSQQGQAINHQWSKSSEFESEWRQLIAREISPQIRYYSVLRPFYEISIVNKFSDLRKYHEVYSSCNRNFHLDGPKTENRWCGDCPKCRFAALTLALSLEPNEVFAILGRDLLDDPGQADGFRSLCALGADKPFECVGEAGECRAALFELGRREAWKNHAVVQALLPELARAEVPDLDRYRAPSGAHFIPDSVARSIPDLAP